MAQKLRKKGEEEIKDIAVKNGIAVGMMATGNFGRGLLKERVSEEILEKLVPEVIKGCMKKTKL